MYNSYSEILNCKFPTCASITLQRAKAHKTHMTLQDSTVQGKTINILVQTALKYASASDICYTYVLYLNILSWRM